MTRGQTAHLKKEFLQHFRECGNVSLAAKEVGITRSQHYHWLKRDLKYAERFADAEGEATDALEAEARRRAHDGYEEPIVYQGEISTGKDGKPLTVRKYSDTLLIFLLKGLRPQKYRDHVEHEHVGPNQGPVKIVVEYATDVCPSGSNTKSG